MLNGKQHLFKPETCVRIWDHALAAGYRGVGISMEVAPPESGGFHHVGMIHAVPELRLHPFFAAVQWATEELLAERAIPVVPCGVVGGIRDRMMKHLSSGRTAKPALIVMGEVSLLTLAELAARSSRIVTVMSACPLHAPAVLNNEAEAVALLLARLKQAGHRDVVWFGRGLRHALTDIAMRAGIRLRVDDQFGAPDTSLRGGRHAADAFLQTTFPADSKPTAVLCSDLSVARGAIAAFRTAGVAIPDELSVAAIGYPDPLDHDSLNITSAGSAPAQIAVGIVELLLENRAAASGLHRCIVPPAQLFVGNSDGRAWRPLPARKLPSRTTRPLCAA